MNLNSTTRKGRKMCIRIKFTLHPKQVKLKAFFKDSPYKRVNK